MTAQPGTRLHRPCGSPTRPIARGNTHGCTCRPSMAPCRPMRMRPHARCAAVYEQFKRCCVSSIACRVRCSPPGGWNKAVYMPHCSSCGVRFRSACPAFTGSEAASPEVLRKSPPDKAWRWRIRNIRSGPASYSSRLASTGWPSAKASSDAKMVTHRHVPWRQQRVLLRCARCKRPAVHLQTSVVRSVMHRLIDTDAAIASKDKRCPLLLCATLAAGREGSEDQEYQPSGDRDNARIP